MQHFTDTLLSNLTDVLHLTKEALFHYSASGNSFCSMVSINSEALLLMSDHVESLSQRIWSKLATPSILWLFHLGYHGKIYGSNQISVF